MKFRVYLKSGSSFVFKASEFTRVRDPLGGSVTQFTWKSYEDNKDKLLYLNFDQVAAVVREA